MSRASTTLLLAASLTACAAESSGPSVEPASADRAPEPVVFVESPTDPEAARAPNPSEGEGAEATAKPRAEVSAEPSSRERAEAKRLYAEGLQHYENAEYADALARWEQAYAIVRMPQLAYNIAKCLEQLGRTQDACARYRELEVDPEARFEDVARDELTRLGC